MNSYIKYSKTKCEIETAGEQKIVDLVVCERISPQSFDSPEECDEIWARWYVNGVLVEDPELTHNQEDCVRDSLEEIQEHEVP